MFLVPFFFVHTVRVRVSLDGEVQSVGWEIEDEGRRKRFKLVLLCFAFPGEDP